MSDLYLANVSKSHYRFTYRLPGRPLATADLAAGTQVKLLSAYAPDVEEHTIVSVVDQIRDLGGMDVADAKRSKSPVALLYSRGKPVDHANLLGIFTANDERAASQVTAALTEAAQAINLGINTETDGGARSVTVEVKDMSKDPQVGDQVVTVENPSIRASRPRNARR